MSKISDVISRSSTVQKGARQDTIQRADKGVPAGKTNTSLGGPSGMSAKGARGDAQSLKQQPSGMSHDARISHELMTKKHPTKHSRG